MWLVFGNTEDRLSLDLCPLIFVESSRVKDYLCSFICNSSKRTCQGILIIINHVLIDICLLELGRSVICLTSSHKNKTYPFQEKFAYEMNHEYHHSFGKLVNINMETTRTAFQIQKLNYMHKSIKN